ncbi:DoxX family membrane protein [Chitinophaga agrisoli]|uniref:DoxX family membrane protein n=1 Tax=Chitinophaga agrisoli TaxID=2607653 RepID=A0A5B2VVX3_9BACT|nr:DoxX family membrane protein [Chitinophaga agrisoli]KAA2242512.1 DoxX family membrane protein [Chitinophaga agrisoli]
MNLLQQIETWGDRHHPKWLDVIRMCLGIFLFYMGVLFIQNRDALTALINEKPFLTVVSFGLGHLIVFAHLAGGLLLALGLLTRVAALANIPVLLGAVLFVHSPTGLFATYSQPGLSILVLLLLILFLVEGGGPLSLDTYMRRHAS